MVLAALELVHPTTSQRGARDERWCMYRGCHLLGMPKVSDLRGLLRTRGASSARCRSRSTETPFDGLSTPYGRILLAATDDRGQRRLHSVPKALGAILAEQLWSWPRVWSAQVTRMGMQRQRAVVCGREVAGHGRGGGRRERSGKYPEPSIPPALFDPHALTGWRSGPACCLA